MVLGACEKELVQSFLEYRGSFKRSLLGIGVIRSTLVFFLKKYKNKENLVSTLQSQVIVPPGPYWVIVVDTMHLLENHDLNYLIFIKYYMKQYKNFYY